MSKAKQKYPELEDIKGDLDSLKENTIELTKHVQKDGAAKTVELKTLAAHRLEELAGTSKEQLHRVEKQIKAKPLKSLAVAFVAGVALSALFRR